MSDAWGGSWGTSWGTSWGGATPPAAPPAAKDSGAGAGHRKKLKIIPLDEWLAIHHPEESVEEQKEVIEELAEAVEEAPPLEAASVAKQIALETRRVENLVSELKSQSSRVQGLTELLHELALYKDALSEAKAAAEKRMKAAHRLLREMDDEEIILTILYHA